MTQRLLFLGLLIAYMFSGVFEVVDNLLGLREFNFDSSAPLAAKVAKEVAMLLLLGTLLYAHRRSAKVRISDLLLAATFAILLVLPTLLVQKTTSASIGYVYLLLSMAVLWVACKASPHVDSRAFDLWFLAPAIIMICGSQLLEIVIAPISLYNESSLLGLDRRAGLAVVPTTAGCLGALAIYRLKRFWRVAALLVVVLANSSIGWACTLLVLVARVRDKRLLLVAAPAAVALLVLVISLRPGFEESSSTRLDLVADSWQQLSLFLPSRTGALATAKSVALDPSASFIADATVLEFAHVFGIIPGIMLLAACMFMVLRATGGIGLMFFVIASSGFLLLEAWIVSVLLIFALVLPAPVMRRRRIGAVGSIGRKSRQHFAPRP